MADIKIKSPIFNALNFLNIDDKYKRIIATDPSILNPFLELSVYFINWSLRVHHVFENNKINKIGDLICKLEELMQFKNFGYSSYHEVTKKLSRHFKKYFSSSQYKNRITQIVNNISQINKHTASDINKGVLGEIINNKITAFTKILSDNKKLEQLLNTPISEIQWSVRTANVFRESNIKRVGDFNKFEGLDLLSLKNFGKKSLNEVHTQLEYFIEKFIIEAGGYEFSLEFIRMVSRDNLEDFVKYILSKIPIRVRGKEIICRRFGLWNGKRETLSEIGKHFSITRERVRQIEVMSLRKIRSLFCYDKCLGLFLKQFFNNKLLPFLEKNYNIANHSELLQIIYDLDNENIGFDLANEFLTSVLGEPIFRRFVIDIDEEVVGLSENDREFYLKLINLTSAYLKEKKIPQSIDDLVQYFEKNQLIKNVNLEKDRIKRFITVSSIAKDSTGKFGLKKWRYFNSKSIHGMAERALIEINKSAHFTQIALLMNELFPEYGPFDSHNVHARIGSRKDIFVWVAPGVFGLKRWGLERPPYVKDYLIKLLKKTNKPMHVNELTERVLEKCNCSKSSVFLTLCMNEDAFIKYPEKFYGLISWK